ncbi:hypothetical protein Tco_1359563 [Tanacetum coccineum]
MCVDVHMNVRCWKWVSWLWVADNAVQNLGCSFGLIDPQWFSNNDCEAHQLLFTWMPSEFLGLRGDALRSLDYMREMVAHDSATLGVLEQLLAGNHVGMCLKAGYMADMEQTEFGIDMQESTPMYGRHKGKVTEREVDAAEITLNCVSASNAHLCRGKWEATCVDADVDTVRVEMVGDIGSKSCEWENGAFVRNRE